MTPVITIALIVMSCVVWVAFLSFELLMEEMREGEWAEMCVSIMIMCCFAALLVIIGNAVIGAWVLGGF